MTNKMLCPACKTELVPGGQKVYETLNDHIGNPNADWLPERSVVVCPNPKCFAHKDECFWSQEDGEGPYSSVWHNDDSVWIDSNPCPFNSFRIFHASEIQKG